jgi:hypothetical protein
VLVSAIIAFFFAPTIIGGHGLAIVPVALAPIFLLGGWPRFAPVLAAELGLVIVVFLVVPFVGFWVLTMLVGLAAMGLRRLRARP